MVSMTKHIYHVLTCLDHGSWHMYKSCGMNFCVIAKAQVQATWRISVWDGLRPLCFAVNSWIYITGIHWTWFCLCLLHVPLASSYFIWWYYIYIIYSIYICASCFLADATAPTTCRGRLSSSLYGRVHTASRITPANILARSRLTQSCMHGWLNLASSRANQVGAFTQICCRIS